MKLVINDCHVDALFNVTYLLVILSYYYDVEDLYSVFWFKF